MMAESASPATPREVFERAQQLLSQPRLDPDALADQFAPDGVFEAPFAPAGLPRRLAGREAIRALYRTAAAVPDRPQFRFSSVVVHETSDPEVVVTEFDVHARHPETGEAYGFANLQVMSVHEGKIAHLRDYWNPLDRPELQALAGGAR